jgi:maltose O-acetyltransferase
MSIDSVHHDSAAHGSGSNHSGDSGPGECDMHGDLPPRGRLGAMLRRLLLHTQSLYLVPSRVRRQLVGWAGVASDEGVILGHGIFFGGGRVRLGKCVFINTGAFLDGSGPIEIGDYVRLGPRVTLLTGSHDYRRSTVRRWPFDPVVARPIVIERGCWLGVNVTVLPGVTVREGCVIAAGAVVVRSTEPNGLYAGNPARRIKDLPTDEAFDEAETLSTLRAGVGRVTKVERP